MNSKKTRVYYNGKRQKDMYQTESKITLFVLHTRDILKKALIIALVALSGGYILSVAFTDTQTYNASAENLPTLILEPNKQAISELKDKIVTKINDCERAGKTEDDALITFDPHKTNKKVEAPSLGTFQYKITTVQYYVKKLYNQDISRKQATLWALDDERARELTHDILIYKGQDTKKELGNWYNCTNKHNLKDIVDIINDLKGHNQ